MPLYVYPLIKLLSAALGSEVGFQGQICILASVKLLQSHEPYSYPKCWIIFIFFHLWKSYKFCIQKIVAGGKKKLVAAKKKCNRLRSLVAYMTSIRNTHDLNVRVKLCSRFILKCLLPHFVLQEWDYLLKVGGYADYPKHWLYTSRNKSLDLFIELENFL